MLYSKLLLLILLFPTLCLAQYSFEQKDAGSFRFESHGHGLPTSENWVGDMSVVDLNGDEHQDILTTSPKGRSGPPVVFLGNGAGKWVRWKELQFPQFAYRFGSILASDFDQDGLHDLVLAMNRLSIQILKNKGHGRFVKWMEAGATGDWSGGRLRDFWSKAIGISDFDGDKRPDLVALSAGRRDEKWDPRNKRTDGVRILSYQPEQGWSYRLLDTEVQFGNDLEIRDMFNSGRGDILTSSLVPGERNLLHYFDDTLHQWLQVELWPLPIRSQFLELEVLDLNLDGRLDIVVHYHQIYSSSMRSGVSVLFQDKFGSWEPYELFPPTNSYKLYQFASGDFDNNKKSELLVFSSDGEAFIFERDEDKLLRWKAEFPIGLEKCWAHEVKGVKLLEASGDELLTGFGSLDLRKQDIHYKCPQGGALGVWKIEKDEIKKKAVTKKKRR